MLFDVKVPSVGESVQEGEVAQWFKKNQEQVAVDDVLVAIDTDKATVEVVAEKAGLLTIKIPVGSLVKVGDILGIIDSTQQTAIPAQANHKTESSDSLRQIDIHNKAQQPKSAESPSHAHVTSPAAERLAKLSGIPTESISGTGKGGRITKEDAMSAAASLQRPETNDSFQAEKKGSSFAPLSGQRSIRIEKMSRIRQKIAERLLSAQSQAAMLTTFNEVDMTEVMAMRAKYKDIFKEKYQTNLGFMSFFVKASVAAMEAFPAVNAFIMGQNIEYHDYCDIGIAVSTPKGLIVPIVKDCQNLSFAEIERRILEFAEKGKAGKITPDDLSGGTFTITNGGVFGSLMSTPILTPPQSAILGMHKIQDRPMVIAGQVVSRPMMYLALTYDHRIVDGKEAVGFLVKIKEMIEDPRRLLIGV